MVSSLFDTNILVDILRKHPPAENWLSTQSDLGVTRIVWLELIEGAQNKAQQQRAPTLLNDFELVELTVSDFDWATRQLVKLPLSHHLDAFDCLIAAPAFRLRLPLFTRNLRHFEPLLGRLAQAPY